MIERWLAVSFPAPGAPAATLSQVPRLSSAARELLPPFSALLAGSIRNLALAFHLAAYPKHTWNGNLYRESYPRKKPALVLQPAFWLHHLKSPRTNGLV